jgi:hypothetical protein
MFQGRRDITGDGRCRGLRPDGRERVDSRRPIGWSERDLLEDSNGEGPELRVGKPVAQDVYCRVSVVSDRVAPRDPLCFVGLSGTFEKVVQISQALAPRPRAIRFQTLLLQVATSAVNDTNASARRR